MNKTAIKNFAIWARNKLIADITYKAGLLGISEKGIKSPLPQSTNGVQFFDIGTKEPYSISGIEIRQRESLAIAIRSKEKQSDYATAYRSVIEEVAYTWFNRLIAVRFMEVNDYLPSHVRVLSSESAGKDEPDLVTNPFDTYLKFTPYEKDRIMQLKQDNELDELFRMLFIKQCNTLNAILPNLFEKTSDYTELLLNLAFTDKDAVVYRLVHDISEDDFNVSKEGQVEIIGWLYQYYNTEPKQAVFDGIKKNIKITKENIPAATQLFTPDWIVRYMVENSLGRLWLEGHPNDSLKSEWKYYLDEAEQEADVRQQLDNIREGYKSLKPEDIKVIDPCMGSGHILVYAFDVLMQIYESYGYSRRDAAKSIIENNLYGLDIDNRAYQLAYFALMMKARQYNRGILNSETKPHVYDIQESNGINRNQLQYFGDGMDDMQRNIAMQQIQGLLDTFIDAKEYGSILKVDSYDWELLHKFVDKLGMSGQLSFDTVGIEDSQSQLRLLVEIGAVMAKKYDVVVTNPPYMKSDNMTSKLSEYVISYKQNVKYDLYAVFICICRDYLKANGIMSLITMHNFMFAPSFKELRNELKLWDWISLLHLGSRAFSEISGEVVQTVAYVIAKSSSNRNLYVIDVTDEKVPDNKKKSFIESKNQGYTFNLKNVDLFPCNAFGYSLSKQIIELYKNKQILDNFGVSKAGVVTGEDEYFIKFWHEIDNNKITYFPKPNELHDYVLFSKGGSFAKWYGNSQHILRLNDMWDDTKTNKSVRRGDISFYYRRGIGWSQMGGGVNKSFSEIENCICKTTTPMFYANNQKHFNYILGYLNSSIPPVILKALNPTLSILTSDILNLPFLYDEKYACQIDELVKASYQIAKNIYEQNEENWQFKRNSLIGVGLIQERFESCSADMVLKYKKMKEYSNTLDGIFIEIMKLRESVCIDCEEDYDTKDKSEEVKRFISYAVGCMFGRYSLDLEGLVYAGGQWDGSKYSTFIPDEDNILPITDEEYFEDDIVGLFVAFVKKVYGSETLEENLDFIAKALGNKGNTSREIIRNYFVKDFFKDHCKVYQKRPIYWLFESGKADGFKALIYMHRYDENTIGNIRVDYLHKMQRVYEREIARMQETIDNSTNAREVAAAEKRKDKLIKQLKEIKDYDEKIAHLALARIPIDLDDGVKVNYEKVQTGTDGKKLEVLAKI